MCMKAPKPPKPQTVAPPPPPPSDEKAQTPVIGDSYGAGDTLDAKRKGRNSLTIPMGGLNIPR
jgi:hypothetical protein